MDVRQPIVSILGHVDHGKTTLLDYIRGSTVAEREAGRITQHIGATEVPIDTIYGVCGKLLGEKSMDIPGLLFIDTPGHHSFTTLRKRGGALADIAVLIIDVREGLKPQTIESIGILKQNKTPFIIALNKIDRLPGWRETPKECFLDSVTAQPYQAQQALDEALYAIIGRLYERGFSAERYDKVADFTKNIALVPISAKTGEGVADLLMVLVGLAQRYLTDQLLREEGCAEGTVLEVKEEKGLGKTMDAIIYKGVLRKEDTLVIGTMKEPVVTKIKAILRPKPLDEIRDPRERFDSIKRVVAAAGVKLSAPNVEGVIAGAPIRAVKSDPEDVISEIMSECRLEVDCAESGLIIKADALGSLEALAFEMREADIPILRAEIGDISRRDIVDAATITDPLRRAIFAFNVNVLPDANEALLEADVKLFRSDIVYKLIEDYTEWHGKKSGELDTDRREVMVHPGMFKVMPDCVFRVSKPAVVGVRVLGGRIRPDQQILREDGRVIGRIKSIQVAGKSEKEALAGAEVAIAVDNITVGRQLCVEDIMYVDIPESHAKKLTESRDLNFDEREILEKVCTIKRKESPFWGM